MKLTIKQKILIAVLSAIVLGFGWMLAMIVDSAI